MIKLKVWKNLCKSLWKFTQVWNSFYYIHIINVDVDMDMINVDLFLTNERLTKLFYKKIFLFILKFVYLKFFIKN